MKIVLTVDGKDVALTVEEAKKAHMELDKIFGKQQTHWRPMTYDNIKLPEPKEEQKHDSYDPYKTIC